MKLSWGLLAYLFFAAGLANAAEVELDFTQFDAVWLFDNPSDRLEDASGNANSLTIGAGSPTYGTPLASTNGFTPWGVFTQPQTSTNLSPGSPGDAFNASGSPRLDTPAGLYTGGDFTISMAARSGAGSNVGFGTILSSQRFQMHQENATVNFRGSGVAGFNGTDAFTSEDWHLLTLRYDSTTGLVESFIQTNTSTLDGLPQTFNVGTTPGYTDISTFGLGLDGLSGIGGVDGFGGASQIDFVIFQDGFLSDGQLQQISDFFADGPPPPPPPLTPEPSSIALFAASIGVFFGLWRRNHRRQA